jgi:hypothetical protein
VTNTWAVTDDQLADLPAITIGTDQTFVRAHPHTFGSSEFDSRHSGNHRWSPIHHRGAIVPVAYAGDNDATAAAETIFRRDIRGQRPPMVAARKYDTWQWSTLQPRRDLMLANLSPAALQTAAIDPDALLNGGADTYTATRGIAERLLNVHNHLDGLFWPSRRYADGRSLVLFGHPGATARSDLNARGPSVPFISTEGTERLRAIATMFDVTILV